MSTVGFEAYSMVNELINELKSSYETVVVIGFSVGATLAWRCSENASCDGVIGCYGSRIRDYLTVTPQCPVFLAFAKQDLFDVPAVVAQLKEKQEVKVEIMDAKHGFVDMYSKNFSDLQTQAFNQHRVKFLTNLKK
jgi:dienelactone hydrolase